MRRFPVKIILKIIFIASVSLFSIVQAPFICSGQDWGVSPIRLDFTTKVTSGILTVSNGTPDKINYQIKAFEWAQDGEGKDKYTETADIIFFPKMMVVEPGDKKIIRAGMKVPRADREKSYRLFIEEIPKPQKAEGAHITFTIRFGVPIFFKPVKEEFKGVIEKISMDKGILAVPIKNTGNSHFVIQTITVKGIGADKETVFSRDLPGWYLLNGVTRQYTTEIPKELCGKIVKLEIDAKTDQFTVKDSLDVQRAMCLQ